MKTKKILKWLAISLLVLLGLLVAIPLFLEAKIGPILKNNVNKSINARFDFADADLSLLRSFPNARVSLTDMVIINKAPFEGDTLFKASEAYLVMGISELFKGEGEPIGIRELFVDGADLRLKVDPEDRANYLIALPDESPATAEQDSEGFTLDLQEYRLQNARIRYEDLKGGIQFELSEINHNGRGDLSLEQSELQTHTDARISFFMDSLQYLNKNSLQLDALIGMDLETDTYTFKENTGTINQMPLVFEGSVRLTEEGQELDLQFKTPDSDFKNFLALVPEAYSGNLEGVATTGQFNLEGTIKGANTETRIPGFEILMQAAGASYKYPQLSKGVSDINFKAALRNQSGQSEDTWLEIPGASFRIDSDVFEFSSTIRELTTNPRVKAALKGSLDLGKIAQTYPLESDPGLAGRLQMDLQSEFDMEAVEKRNYSRIKTSGTLSAKELRFESASFKDPVNIQNAALSFDPATARLQQFSGRLGQSDFSLTGSLRNYLGALLSDGLLQGNFELNSQKLVVSDFQTPEATEAGQGGEPAAAAFKIPANLDLVINGRAAEVQYDKLPLKEVSGELRIHDQKIEFREVRSRALEGSLSLNGELNTLQDKPRFDMNLGISDFKISETFKAIELFRTLAPIASILEGRLNSTVNLSGALTDDFSPDLMSLGGKVAAELLTSEINGRKAQVMQALDSRLEFLNMEKLDLRSLKTALSFENGRVQVKPFTIAYEDIAIEVSGGHTFDQQLNYKAVLNVPSKYLGPEVNKLITQLNDPSLQGLTIPVTAQIGGNYNSPQVSTDFSSGVKQLGDHLVALQKQRLIDKGSEKAKSLLGSILTGQQTTTDSTATGGAAEKGIGGILKEVSGTTPKDSTAPKTSTGEQVAKKAAKDLLGGLLGKKKKDTVKTAKDSVQ
ncbi:AsmA family protein [Robiginitalea sp. IMCC44478]|uniref:AsmA family protein n=1 Tax=Robiginitalea sp. IMCC44478 TaxID=3459122 RepID=UPI00404284D5